MGQNREEITGIFTSPSPRPGRAGDLDVIREVSIIIGN